MRLMCDRFLTDGMIPEPGDVERLTALLGRPLHSYRRFPVAPVTRTLMSDSVAVPLMVQQTVYLDGPSYWWNTWTCHGTRARRIQC